MKCPPAKRILTGDTVPHVLAEVIPDLPQLETTEISCRLNGHAAKLGRAHEKISAPHGEIILGGAVRRSIWYFREVPLLSPDHEPPQVIPRPFNEMIV